MSTFDATLGAFFVGVVVAATLLGVTIIQAFSYYLTFPKDPWYIKTSVALLCCYDLGHQISVTSALYTDTVTGWGQPAVLNKIAWGLISQTYFNALTAITVQSFYLYRIYKLLKRNWIVPSILFCASVAQFIAAFVYAIKCTTISADQIPTLTNLVSIVNGISAGLDVIIAAIMVTVLLRSRTGIRKTDSIIRKLIVYIVNSGLLTSAVAVGVAISLKAAPQTYAAYPFYFCLGRLYVNSLLASLNARSTLHDSSSEPSEWSNDFDLSYSNRTPTTGRDGPSFQTSTGVVISIEQQMETDVESYGHDKVKDSL